MATSNAAGPGRGGSGLGGAVISYLGRSSPVSLGASTALCGLLGMALVDLLMGRGRYPEAWRRTMMTMVGLLIPLSLLPGLDLQMAVPWKSGIPEVSVKIYSLNGQELVTLQSGSLSEGKYTAQWDGSDAFGRQVASGAYFCKLQLDQWSVTRRVVFLR